MKFLTDNFFLNRKKVYYTLFLVPFLPYFKSIFYDFSPFDEQWLILKNQNVLEDWSKLDIIFSKPLAGMYYRPFLNTWLMLDYHIGGPNPFIYHFSSVLLHGLCVILLFMILNLLVKDARTSFLFATIFAVHPINLHTVAWVPGKNDLLLTFFILTSIYCLIRYLLEPRSFFLILHFVFFSLALFTKENAFLVILPFSVLIFGRSKKLLLTQLFFWIFLIAVWYIIRQQVVPHYIPVRTDLANSFMKFFLGLFMSIGKIFVPYPQSVFPITQTFPVISGILVIVLLIYLLLKFEHKEKRYSLMGLMLFFATVSVPLWYAANSSTGEQYEHRLYLPLCGVLIFISQFQFKKDPKWITNFSLVLILIFSTKTFIRMDVYRSPQSFCDSGINDGSNYFQFYFEKGNQLFAEKKYHEAIEQFNKALELQPNRPQILHNRANALLEINELNSAIIDYTSAYKHSGEDPMILVSRCVAYNRFGRMPEALKDLNSLKQICPKCLPPGLEQNIRTNYEKYEFNAIQKLIKKNPTVALYYVRRAKMYLDHKMPKESLEDLKKACELEPENEEFKQYLQELSKSYKP